MGRAYICIARTDLIPNELQVPDLAPNTSQNIPAYNPAGGQTGYLSYLTTFEFPSTTASMAGLRTVDSTVHGLAAYLMDNVEDVQDGNLSLTDSAAAAIALAIMARVATGGQLDIASINGLINTELAGAPNSGLATADSTGSVAAVLRILSGEVYRLEEGAAVSEAANGFPGAGVLHTPVGYFLEAPVPYTAGHPAGSGRSFLAPLAPREPAQTAPHSWDYRDIRPLIETSDMWRSVLAGRLSELTQSTFRFFNPKFNYNVTVGPGVDVTRDAFTLAGGTITAPPDDHAYEARGVTVYDEDGVVITI